METRPRPHRNHAPSAGDSRVRPLSAALGAEIIGIDLSKDIDEHVCAQIRDAWHQHLVILLRDQELSEEDQVRFAEMFGPPAVIHTKQFVRSHPAVMLISNVRKDGKLIGILPDGEVHFHSDQSYTEQPTQGTMLYAITIPKSGGNTLFANCYKAYETLPDDVKAHPRSQGAPRLRLQPQSDAPQSSDRRRIAEVGPADGARPSRRPAARRCT